VVVVADDCTDQTAERARAAGAHVLERQDPLKRGKGYALEYGFDFCERDGRSDAVVVVDADTLVSRNLLQAFSARLTLGAEAVQAEYAVRNPEASWRTRLLVIALALFHVVRSRGRERLRVSCGLRGNGMCFTRRLLREVPHDAFSIVEDVEYGIRLGLAGRRVHFGGEAKVFGEMVPGERQSRSQRRRWEQGRWVLAKEYGPRLLWEGLRRTDRVRLDLALDLLVPPLAQLLGLTLLGGIMAAGASFVAGRPLLAAWAWGLCLVFVVIYVFRGWTVSGTGLRGLFDLLRAPAYMVWKLKLALLGEGSKKQDEWVRTAREGEDAVGGGR
jgi:glycosyltransferase involved in cell wall biosynthesis